MVGRVDGLARGSGKPLGNDAGTLAVGDLALQHKLVRPGGLQSRNEKKRKLAVVGASEGPRAVPLCKSGEAEFLGPVNLDSVAEKRYRKTKAAVRRKKVIPYNNRGLKATEPNK